MPQQLYTVIGYHDSSGVTFTKECRANNAHEAMAKTADAIDEDDVTIVGAVTGVVPYFTPPCEDSGKIASAADLRLEPEPEPEDKPLRRYQVRVESNVTLRRHAYAVVHAVSAEAALVTIRLRCDAGFNAEEIGLDPDSIEEGTEADSVTDWEVPSYAEAAEWVEEVEDDDREDYQYIEVGGEPPLELEEEG